ncbi:MAG: SMP-30/gluconolactonase/LRE family protein [Myxococcota bacterium]
MIQIETPEIVQVVPTQDLIGESPQWIPEAGMLYWVDVRRGILHRWRPSDGHRQDWSLPRPMGCFAVRHDGTLLVAQGADLAWFDPSTGEHTLAVTLEAGDGQRINDGGCDSAGRFWVTTMTNNIAMPLVEGAGSAYCVRPDLSFTRVRSDMTIPNTVVWSPDARTMLIGDSTPRTISAYDFDVEAGTISNERIFYAFGEDEAGVPDGSAVDEEGGIWNARWGGGCVVRHLPDGRIDRIIQMPVSQPACCAFGGPDMRTLYVTTARDELTAEQLAAAPMAGSVFAFQPGVRGCLKPRFAG